MFLNPNSDLEHWQQSQKHKQTNKIYLKTNKINELLANKTNVKKREASY